MKPLPTPLIEADIIRPDAAQAPAASLSVSLVTYHTDNAELGRCLQSLDCDTVAEITVRDNSASAATEKFLSGRPKTRYIPGANVGYGAAHNDAFRSRSSGAPYHLVLNTDVEFDSAILPELVAVMERNPTINLIQPLLLGLDGARQYAVRKLPSPADLILRRFLPSWWCRARRRDYLLCDLDTGHAWHLPYMQGSFMLLRSSAFAECGGFDSRFFMYPEDIDLSRRLFPGGGTLFYPFVSAVHAHRQASYASGRMLRIHIVNICRYFNKWGWLHDPERRRINKAIDLVLARCRNGREPSVDTPRRR